MTKRTDREAELAASFELMAPWMKGIAAGRKANVGMQLVRSEDIETFVKTRTQVHTTYIQETQRTRRLGLWLAAGLLAVACLIPIFAPAGREALSYWIGLALFVFAAGSMGYTSIKIASDKRKMEITRDAPDV